MTRLILTSLVAALLAASGPASANTTPMRQHLKNELPTYGFKDVDVDGLTNVQVAHIHHLLHSNKSPAKIRGNIGAILGDSILNLFKK